MSEEAMIKTIKDLKQKGELINEIIKLHEKFILDISKIKLPEYAEGLRESAINYWNTGKLLFIYEYSENFDIRKYKIMEKKLLIRFKQLIEN